MTLALYNGDDDGSLIVSLASIQRSLTQRASPRTVINMSFGAHRRFQNAAFWNRLRDRMQSLANTGSVMFVVAAGNDGSFTPEASMENFYPQRWGNPQDADHIPQILIVGGAIHDAGATNGLRDPNSDGGVQNMVYASFDVHCATAQQNTLGPKSGSSCCKNTCTCFEIH
jgi:hypothetical protein